MLAKSLRTVLIIGSFLSLVGCYQTHSDDDLRTVPATNNPNIIQDAHRHTVMTGPTH